MVYHVINKEKYFRDFISLYLLVLTFAMKLRSAIYKIHWKILEFCNQMKYDVIFEYVPRRNFWFCFISIVWVHVIKLRILKYFNDFWFLIKKNMVSDLNMFHRKMYDFVSILLFRFTFDLESHWNTLIFLDRKMMRALIISCQTVYGLV